MLKDQILKLEEQLQEILNRYIFTSDTDGLIRDTTLAYQVYYPYTEVYLAEVDESKTLSVYYRENQDDAFMLTTTTITKNAE